jgi:drug/metabolite transporter (DMT)-like permease
VNLKEPTGIVTVVFVIGIAFALAASLLFYAGIALQALEARKAPRGRGLRLSLLELLLRKPLWVLGLLLGLVGVAPQIVAFATAPFVVVQPLLAVGLLLLLFLGARLFSEPVELPNWLAALAIIGGIVLVSVGAPPHSESHRGGAAVIGVVALLSVPALLPLLRVRSLTAPYVVLVACGLGFAATNVVVKLIGDDVGLGHWPNAVLWTVVAGIDGVAATITNMTAFQLLPATVVVPVSTAVQTFFPIALEPLFLRERAPSTPELLALAGGLALSLAGTVQLARTQAVSGVVAGSSRT